MGKPKTKKPLCEVRTVCLLHRGASRPEIDTATVLLEDARKFERVLEKHREWRMRSPSKARYEQTFTLNDANGKGKEFVLDLVMDLKIKATED